jgi:molybdenum cofactor cytidylyltransferase
LEFGEIPLREALGCILAHKMRVPGHVFPKGMVLDAAALRRLKDAGNRHVTAARLTPHEIPENDAARRLSQALISADAIREWKKLWSSKRPRA